MNKTKADDESLSFLTILESNGIDDTLWCCRAAPEYDKEWRLFAVWCGRQVQHLMLDKRNITAYASAADDAASAARADDAARAAAGVAQKEQFILIIS